jgi:hypothetical protein
MSKYSAQLRQRCAAFDSIVVVHCDHTANSSAQSHTSILTHKFITVSYKVTQLATFYNTAGSDPLMLSGMPHSV